MCGEKFDLEKSAINLAIAILDRFMDGHDFTDSDSLPYVCMASLSLAAKFDCKETRVPKYRQVPLVLVIFFLFPIVEVSFNH